MLLFYAGLIIDACVFSADCRIYLYVALFWYCD